MRTLLRQNKTLWALIALAVAIIAFVAGVSYGLRNSGGILAQGVTPTPTSAPLVITEDTMHLLPPLDLTAVRQYPEPPCVEKFRRKYSQGTGITISFNETRCHLKDRNGRYITEAEADDLVAQRAAMAAASGKWVNPVLSARSITLLDGTVVNLPDDVKIAARHEPRLSCSGPCPRIPLYKLVRGDSVIWIDSMGYVINYYGDVSESGGFQIPGIVDRRR